MSRYYTDEFKQKIVELRKVGRTLSDLSREYKLAKSSISNWEKQFENSGRFTVKDNLSNEEKELRVLRKENKLLRMENDILKQAALILGRKSE